MKALILIFTLLIATSCLATDFDAKQEREAITNTLTSFHLAATKAEGEKYFSLLTDDAIFLGTDASERWSKTEFKAFALPYFSQGKGWEYVAQERNISFTPANNIAFFDELLFNKNYGLCRGSGVLVKTAQGWKISQYNLAVMLPNAIAKDISKQIQAYQIKVNKSNESK